MKTRCVVDGCHRRYEGKHNGLTYCRKHLYSVKKYGSPLYIEAEKALTQLLKENELIGKCTVKECDQEAYAKELCKLHYMRKFRTGATELIDRKELTHCLAFDCEEAHYQDGFCEEHYELSRVNKGSPYKAKIIKLCGVEDCEEPHYSKGMCKKHYQNLQYHMKYHDIL